MTWAPSATDSGNSTNGVKNAPFTTISSKKKITTHPLAASLSRNQQHIARSRFKSLATLQRILSAHHTTLLFGMGAGDQVPTRLTGEPITVDFYPLHTINLDSITYITEALNERTGQLHELARLTILTPTYFFYIHMVAS